MTKQSSSVYDFRSEDDDDEEAMAKASSMMLDNTRRKRLRMRCDYASIHANFRPTLRSENIISKLQNRVRNGYFNGETTQKCNVRPYNEVPNNMSFCLKDIVPYCYLENGHVFMGLTSCGNFLISFKGSCEYEESMITRDFGFSSSYKYELFFWIYRPHLLLTKYYNICLFDDHGVDDIQIVTMANWQSGNNRRVLIVHGTSEKDDGDSHVTIVHIPKMGCLDCKQLRDEIDDDFPRQDILCISCNLTIHTKYRKSESHPNFNANINLNCPGYVIMIENSCIHTISVSLELNKAQRVYSGVINSKYLRNYDKKVKKDDQKMAKAKVVVEEKSAEPRMKESVSFQASTSHAEPVAVKMKNIAEEIIADFEEFETEYHKTAIFPHLDRRIVKTRRNDEELIITCGGSEATFATVQRTAEDTVRPIPSINVQLINHKSKQAESPITMTESPSPIKRPIISHAYALRSKYKSTTIAQQPQEITATPSSSAANTDSLKSPTIVPTSNTTTNINLYDFAEEEETDGKCEKISTFRKRRLADKKYEFSEDNSENIVPFNRIRNRVRSRLSQLQYRPAGGMSPSTTTSQQQQQTSINSSSFLNGTQWLFNTSPPNYEASHLHTHLHYSPQHGFRSPCGSPVGNRCLRSPPGIRSPNYHQRSPSTFCYAKTTASYHHSSALAPKQLMRSNESNIITASPTRSAVHGLEEFPKFLIDAIQKANEKRAVMAAGAKEPMFNDTDSACSEKGCDDEKSGMVEKPEKPVCSKKFVKRFVEEDDANSVVTNEEDDCISPGYHASLPMEVHGSCYSNMQIISEISYKTLKCPGVVITQNSFDLETFTFYVANHLCVADCKKYGILYDSAYEIIHVCPVSCTLTCILMLKFTASDLEKCNSCKCSNTLNCMTHCQVYQSQTMFTWNMESGHWNCLDYGHMETSSTAAGFGGKTNKKLSSAPDKTTMMSKLTRLTKALFDSGHNDNEVLNHLRILDSCNEKTKDKLIDLDNMIEFYRKGGGDVSSSSDISSNDEEDEDDDDESVVNAEVSDDSDDD